METLNPPTDVPGPIVVRCAKADDRLVLDRLWLIFRHHMSSYTGGLPNADGTYRSERLESAFTDPAWGAWMLTAGQHPIGFALTRSLDEPVKVISSFFVVTPARRSGLGSALARAVVSATPGRWSVAYQDVNITAAHFWPTVAASLDPDWRLDRRPVPDRPDLPPDTWVSFTSDLRDEAGAR